MYNTLQIRQNIEDVLRKMGKNLIKIGKNLQKFNCTNLGVYANDAEHIDIDSEVINQQTNVVHDGYISIHSQLINSQNKHSDYINLGNLEQTNLVGTHHHNYINLDEFDNMKHNSDFHNIKDAYV